MARSAERLEPPSRRSDGGYPGFDAEATGLVPYSAGDFFVVRSPVQPQQRLLDWCSGAGCATLESPDTNDDLQWAARRTALTAELRAIFSQPFLRRAMYFASPELEQLCDSSAELSPNLIRTLTRYYMRAAGRETPFGLFAGVSLARIAEQDRFELGPERTNRSATSVSVCYLQQLLTELGSHQPVRDALRHTLTSTLVRLDGRYRFTTNNPTPADSAQQRSPCLTFDLAATPQVDRAVKLSAPGLTPKELARKIARVGIPHADALEFARALCQRGLLVLELLPGATGHDAHEAIAHLSERLGSSAHAKVLSAVASDLAEADAGGKDLGSTPFRTIAAKLTRLVTPVKARHPLQTALVKPAPLMAMSKAVAQLFLEAAELVQRTSRAPDHSALREFRGSFLERFGTATVPLGRALDTEIGIDFGDARASAPLLKGIPITPKPGTAPHFDDLDRVRQKLLQRALRSGELVYELADDMLDEFPKRVEADHEAESFVVVARLARDANGELSVIAPGIMPSALKMLARFCHAEPALVDVLRRQAELEQSLAPDALLADVAYLPNSEAANVVARPVLRAYEVPYLGRSGAPLSQQIAISDLYVRVQNERVELYSGERQKRVKIRISNALNQTHEAHPPLYRFLAALQAQDEASLAAAWSWGALDNSEFLPRIVRAHTVLSLACWQLSLQDLQPAVSSEGAPAFRAMQALRMRLRLPRWLTRGIGDQRLPIDLDNELSVEEMLHEARQQRGLAVQEMLPRPDQLVLQGPEGAYAGEFVVPFSRRAPVMETRSPPAVKTGRALSVKRHYPPGSDWLYAKIYAAPSRIDTILKRIQSDVVGPLRGAGFDVWFYLPFADPYPHLRVRFKGAPNSLNRMVLPALQRLCEAELSRGGAWRLQLDTYEQEQERYGGPLGVELAERIFSADSDACSELIAICERGSDYRWQVALLGIDRLLADCKFEIAERLIIAREASEAYGKEAGADLATWQAIGVKYRAQTPRLSELLWLTPERAHGSDQRVLQVLAQRSLQIGPVLRDIERARLGGEVHATLRDLALSFTHMHAVRLLGVEARAHELLLFDFLKRLYTSRLARTRDLPPILVST